MVAKRPAYSLVEMIIVVAIIAALMALAWPSFARPAGRWQLVYVAKQLRGELAHARLEAIRTGKPWQFCYEQGGRRYFISPLAAEEFVSWEGTAGAGTATRLEVLNSGMEYPRGVAELGVNANDVAEGEAVKDLPLGIFFVAGADLGQGFRGRGAPAEVTAGTFDALLGDQEEGPAVILEESSPAGSDGLATAVGENFANTRGGGGWRRIVFLPTGRTAFNQSFSLYAADGTSLTLLVRAVTGTAVIGQLRRAGPGVHDSLFRQNTFQPTRAEP